MVHPADHAAHLASGSPGSRRAIMRQSARPEQLGYPAPFECRFGRVKLPDSRPSVNNHT
jgi:hypothetical protein